MVEVTNMKKKLLIIALPFFMALSSCAAAPFTPVEKANDGDLMLEDTKAHEDLFGDIKLAPRKLGDPEGGSVGEDPSWTKMPRIGVQFASYTKEAATVYAVRYVAAIAGLEGGAITAEWTRGVSEKTGNEIKSIGGGHFSTVEYDTLNNGGTPKAATSEGTGYNKYIVYTLYDIPAAQVDSYVVAYLTLSKAEQQDAVSKAVAARVGGENAFSFYADEEAHFLQGKINNSENSLVFATENPGGNNFAAYYGIHLLSTDSFGSFYYSSTHFLYFGYETYFTQEDRYDESGLGGYVAPKESGTYNLYLSNNEGHHNHVYTAEGHVWMANIGGGFPVRFNACEEGGSTKYYIENVDIVAGQELKIYKDNVLDSTTYTVKENVSNNNIYTSNVFKNTGKASIYLNTDGGIWVSVPVAGFKTINIDLNPEYWGSDGALAASHYFAWAWKKDNDGGVWYNVEVGVGTAATVDVPGQCDTIHLIRRSSSTPSWSDNWDETGDITIEAGKTLTFTGWKAAEFR